jgi:hypothetical protein
LSGRRTRHLEGGSSSLPCLGFTASLPSSARLSTSPKARRPRPSKIRGRHAIGKVSFLRSRGPGILQPGDGHGVRCVRCPDDVDPDKPALGRSWTPTAARCSLRRLDPRRQPYRITAASALLPFDPHRHEADGNRSAAHLTLLERSASRRSTELAGSRPSRLFVLRGRWSIALTEVFAMPSHVPRTPGLPRVHVRHANPSQRSSRARGTLERTPCRSRTHRAPRSREGAPLTEVRAIDVGDESPTPPWQSFRPLRRASQHASGSRLPSVVHLTQQAALGRSTSGPCSTDESGRRPPLPVNRRPFLPWVCFPFEALLPTARWTDTSEEAARSRAGFTGARAEARTPRPIASVRGWSGLDSQANPNSLPGVSDVKELPTIWASWPLPKSRPEGRSVGRVPAPIRISS